MLKYFHNLIILGKPYLLNSNTKSCVSKGVNQQIFIQLAKSCFAPIVIGYGIFER